MILGDLDIAYIAKKGSISPFSEDQVNPNSYDLRIGTELKTYVKGQDDVLDCKKENVTRSHVIPEYGFILIPGIIYLANTIETIDLRPILEYPTLCGTLMGKSSLGRLGLDVHISAGFIDTGFKGQIVLELRVEQPLRIYPNMLIAQLKFEMSTSVDKPYGSLTKSKYQNQVGIVASKMYQNFTQETSTKLPIIEVQITERYRDGGSLDVIDKDGKEYHMRFRGGNPAKYDITNSSGKTVNANFLIVTEFTK